MKDITQDPIKELVKDLLIERYEGVTFSDDIIDTIETKVAPVIKKHTEEAVVDFVSDYFSAKKPTRKPRRTLPKKETQPEPEGDTPPSDTKKEESDTSEPSDKKPTPPSTVE